MCSFFKTHKTTLIYSIVLALLLLAMRWAEYRFVVINSAQELYTGFIALLFTGLGIWLTLKLSKSKTGNLIIEPVKPIITENTPLLSDIHNLSKREVEVLQLMAIGHSNA